MLCSGRRPAVLLWYWFLTPVGSAPWWGLALVTHSFLFCQLFTIKDQCEVCIFCSRFSWQCRGTSAPSATHLTVSLDLCRIRGKRTRRVEGLWRKGTLSAQKALQGSETKTRKLLRGTKESYIFQGVKPFFKTRPINYILQKKQ